MTAHAPIVTIASRAEHVQRITTPAGIEAWLVESLRRAARRARIRDPRRRVAGPCAEARTGDLLAAMLDEGAGTLRRARLPSRHRRSRDPYGFAPIATRSLAHAHSRRGCRQAVRRSCGSRSTMRGSTPSRRARAEPTRARMKRDANDPDSMACETSAKRPSRTIPMGARCAAILRRSPARRAKTSSPCAMRLTRDRSQDRRRRRDRRDNALASARRGVRRAGAQKRSRAGRADRSRQCRHAPSRRSRRAAIDDPLRTPGDHQARSRLLSPPSSPITFWAAAPSRRGCSARCARSAAWPIRSIRISTHMTIARCSSAPPRPRTSAPAKRSA